MRNLMYFLSGHDDRLSIGMFGNMEKRYFLNDSKFTGIVLTAAHALIDKLNDTHRPNIEQREDGLYVCWNNHDKNDPCEYEKVWDYEQFLAHSQKATT